jgi:hypothetical protein
MLRLFSLLLLTMLCLTGCASLIGSDEVPDPVGIGYDPNELKRSPCACLEVPQQWGNLG